jgi:predicted  nucleic acid-binding Zn-ribbon protein
MARIEFVDADGRPQRFEIPETTTGAVIGRSPSANCVIPNHSVGRSHGRIAFQSGQFAYTDLGSVNGSYLNDRKVTGTETLADGDVILLGEVQVRFVQEPRRPTGPVRTGDSEGRTMIEHDLPPLPEPVASRPVAAVVPEAAIRPTLASAPSVVEAPRPQAQPTAPLSNAPSAPAAVSSDAAAQRGRADALSGTLAQREEEVRHLRGLIADGERRLKEAESRATVATSSLESMHAKYLDMRDQVSHLQAQVDRVRGEGSDREVEASELREQVASLTAQVQSIRGRTGQHTEEIGNLKVKLTERDREVERLRRELDGREYDLKALREENERLEEYCHSDTGRQQELERKSRNLEAVIDENRNLIASLRRDVEKKEDELRKVRLGVGIADLEQEKTRLLEDYHRKNRELDELRTQTAALHAQTKVLAAEKADLEARIRDLEEAARARRSERGDISDHPEFRAKAREAETLAETVRVLSADLDVLRAEIADLPEQRALLSAEAAAAVEKVRNLSARVDDLQAELARRPVVASAPEAGSPAPELAAALSSVGEALAILGDGLMVLQATLKDAMAVLEALDAADVPAAVRAALGSSSPGEMAESVRDVRRMLGEDLDALRAAWEAGRSLWQPLP